MFGSAFSSSHSSRLLALLETTFAYISFPELRPVPIKVLKHIERIPEAVLGELAKEDLYKECPIEVPPASLLLQLIPFRSSDRSGKSQRFGFALKWPLLSPPLCRTIGLGCAKHPPSSRQVSLYSLSPRNGPDSSRTST